MKCPRCEREFAFEFLNVQQWLKSTTLDSEQLSFLLCNYEGPLCSECTADFQSSFYASGVNPAMVKPKSNQKR
ncbi:MAG: hypothetical protein K2H97_08050 [Prevotella sp.]|nr:hypothetical protein [Prevotella sp.]